MSLQASGQNRNLQHSPLTHSPIHSSDQAFSGFWTVQQPPATKPWSHLDMSLYDFDRNRDVAPQCANYGSQTPDQDPSQLFLPLTDFPSTMQMRSSASRNEYMTQMSHQANSSNINGTEQPSVAGSLVETPYRQVINSQDTTNLDLSVTGSFNFEFMQMNDQQTDQGINNSIATYPYPDNPFGCTVEMKSYSPSLMSPCESPGNSFNRTSQGASPCNSYSPSGQSPDSSKIVPGGRRKGSNLGEESKMNAVRVRLIGSCWRCSLRRDSVRITIILCCL